MLWIGHRDFKFDIALRYHRELDQPFLEDAMNSTVVPSLRYRDTPAMIDWLCNNFGFERRLVISGKNETVAHAELTLGGGMVMLGTHADDAYGALLTTPEKTGGLQTQTIWIRVDDADEMYTRVVESGAAILQRIDDVPQGGRAFSCRDPEGHVWQVGTYDPWAA